MRRLLRTTNGPPDEQTRAFILSMHQQPEYQSSPLEQILRTCLSPQILRPRLAVTLTNHNRTEWQESLAFTHLTEGSRLGDLAINAFSFSRNRTPTRNHRSEEHEIVSEEEFVQRQRPRFDVTLFRGSAQDSRSSLIYRAATLLAEAMRRSALNDTSLRVGPREKTISEGAIVEKLTASSIPCPFSGSHSNSVEYQLVDDDRSNMMFLRFTRDDKEVVATLATVPYGENSSMSFVLRDPTSGGGTLWSIRSAIVCLGAALRAPQDQTP